MSGRRAGGPAGRRADKVTVVARRAGGCFCNSSGASRGVAAGPSAGWNQSKAVKISRNQPNSVKISRSATLQHRTASLDRASARPSAISHRAASRRPASAAQSSAVRPACPGAGGGDMVGFKSRGRADDGIRIGRGKEGGRGRGRSAEKEEGCARADEGIKIGIG